MGLANLPLSELLLWFLWFQTGSCGFSLFVLVWFWFQPGCFGFEWFWKKHIFQPWIVFGLSSSKFIDLQARPHVRGHGCLSMFTHKPNLHTIDFIPALHAQTQMKSFVRYLLVMVCHWWHPPVQVINVPCGRDPWLEHFGAAGVLMLECFLPLSS